MSLFDEMNRRARRFAKALLRAFPDFGDDLRVMEGGHFMAQLPAPVGSRTGGLACSSVADGDVWIQLAVPNAFYLVETEVEMRRVLRCFLADEILFVLISKNRRWHGTTLTRVGSRPRLKAGETMRLLSWSGKYDLVARFAQARTAKLRLKPRASSPNASRRSRPTSR